MTDSITREAQLSEGVSRRNFLRTGAAAGAAALIGSTAIMAGCAPQGKQELSSTGETSSGYEWADSADVVFIGGGTSMMGAVKAAEAGASVIVIDKNIFLGGDMAVNEGIIYATETSVMKERGGVIDPRTGEEDTIDSMVSDWLRHAHDGVNETMVRNIAERGPALIDWFRERGVNFGLYQSGTDPVTRGHQWTAEPNSDSAPTPAAGHNFVDVLSAEFDKLGVRTYLNTKALEILRDDLNNVIGVKAQNEDGDVVFYGAKAVVLATGAAGDNKSMTMMYNPEAINWGNVGLPGQTGDGYFLAAPLGAAIVGMMSWDDPVTPNPGLSNMVLGDGTNDITTVYTYEFNRSAPRAFIYVDYKGDRFTDDSKGYVNGSARDISRTGTGTCWVVFDSTMWEEPMFADFYSEKKDRWLENGVLKQSDSIENLASQLSIDPTALKATVDQWNSYCNNGADLDFERPAECMKAIEKGPFFSYGLQPASSGMCTGARISLDVDEDYRVLDRDGKPIKGVYATGLALTWYRQIGHGYPGSGVACACMAGTGICGEKVAEYALSR